MLWLDASLNAIASAAVYEPVVLVAYAETTGPETGVTVTITTSPEGFTPTDWTYAPYALGTFAPHPVRTAPQTLALGNTAPIPNFGTPGVYLLIYGFFTSTGSKTFAATVDTAQSTAISASASLTVTGAVPRTVTVDLYSAANPPVLLQSSIPVRDGGYWTDEDSDAGAAEVTVPELWSGVNDAVEGRLLRFRVNGTADRTAIVERVRVVPGAARPADRVRTLTGRDWLAEFDDALVDPPLGLASRPQVQSVRFDWTHPDLFIPTDPALYPPGVRWIRPYNMGALYKGDVDALANPVQAYRVGKMGQAPRGWPDSFSGWMWERPYDGSYSHPVMTAYFDFALYFDPAPPSNLIGIDRAVANRPFVMVFTADDVGQLAFDGAVVDSGVEPPAIQWQRCNSIVIPDVSPGWHTIRIKAQNRPYTQFGGNYNMGAVAFCAFQPLEDLRNNTLYAPLLVDAYDPVYNLVARTAGQVANTQITTLNISQGGGWWTIGGEHVGGDPDAAFAPGFQTPSFTVGEAFRLLFESAQGEGHLPGWTLGFNDLNDSNGNPWPRTDELTAKVSDTLLAVIRSWHDEGHWDVAARASTRVLDAYVWQERGNYHLNGTPLTWDGTYLSNVTIEGER